jgi:hypothetical protein
LVTGTAAFAVASFVMANLPLHGFWQNLLLVLAGGVAGVLSYTVMVFILNIKEAKALPHLLSKR